MSCAGKRISLQRLITLSILLIGLLSGTIGVGCNKCARHP